MDSLAGLLHFQLKYCERCGGLWLRPDGADAQYCPRCARFMAGLPVARPRHPRKPESSASTVDAIVLLASLLCFSFQLISGVCA